MPHAITALILWCTSFIIYVTCNKGLPRNCIRQQFRRYLIAAIIATVPAAVTKTDILQPATLIAAIIALLWIVTYPLLFHLTKRKSGTEYDNQIDPAFGIYLYGWLQGIFVLIPGAQYFITFIELPLLLIPIAEWGYLPISGGRVLPLMESLPCYNNTYSSHNSLWMGKHCYSFHNGNMQLVADCHSSSCYSFHYSIHMEAQKRALYKNWHSNLVPFGQRVYSAK